MRIRKRFRVLIMAAAAATVVVPVGLSFTLPSNASRTRAGMTNTAAQVVSSRSVVVPSASIGGPAAVIITPIEPYGSGLDEMPDSAKLFLVGTLLVGAAAVVRKAA